MVMGLFNRKKVYETISERQEWDLRFLAIRLRPGDAVVFTEARERFTERLSAKLAALNGADSFEVEELMSGDGKKIMIKTVKRLWELSREELTRLEQLVGHPLKDGGKNAPILYDFRPVGK